MLMLTIIETETLKITSKLLPKPLSIVKKCDIIKSISEGEINK